MLFKTFQAKVSALALLIIRIRRYQVAYLGVLATLIIVVQFRGPSAQVPIQGQLAQISRTQNLGGVTKIHLISSAPAIGPIESWNYLLPDPNYFHKSWAISGRKWLEPLAGLKWDDASKTWRVNTQWPDADNPAPKAYYIEYATQGAVQTALMHQDVQLIDELANFHLAYFQRFTTLGQLRARKAPDLSTKSLEGRGSDSAHTLPWLYKGADEQDDEQNVSLFKKGVSLLKKVKGIRLQENPIANSQFFHPASRLIRVISALPPEKRTPLMQQFVAAYAPLIVREHLLRLAYEVQWPNRGNKKLPSQLISVWRTIIDSNEPPDRSFYHSMSDRDLWMIATAAEILGASANDPGSGSHQQY